MSWNLWLDDTRDPRYHDGDNEGYWVWATSSEEALRIVGNEGCPDNMALDHDLGGEDSGMKFLKGLVKMDEDGLIDVSKCRMSVHSSNFEAGKNMVAFFASYLRSRTTHDASKKETPKEV